MVSLVWMAGCERGEKVGMFAKGVHLKKKNQPGSYEYRGADGRKMAAPPLLLMTKNCLLLFC